MAIATINPATGETVREFDSLTEAQVDEALDRALYLARRRIGRSLGGGSTRCRHASSAVRRDGARVGDVVAVVATGPRLLRGDRRTHARARSLAHALTARAPRITLRSPMSASVGSTR